MPLRWGPDKVLPLGSRMISSLLKHSASNLEAFQSEAHSPIQEALEKDEPLTREGSADPLGHSPKSGLESGCDNKAKRAFKCFKS